MSMASVSEERRAPAEPPSVWSPVAREALPRMPQLDGLRAFAVAGVIVHHYGPNLPHSNLGASGVILFFVLSGFLITGILLQCRRIVASGESRLLVTRQFYARRFLRIFPVFYLTIAVYLVVGGTHFRNTAWWHALYLSNIYFAKLGHWDGIVSHFWSLAVEEQFYLVWPWAMLFLPKRALIPFTALVVLAGVGFRLAATMAGLNEIACSSLTFAQFDSLGTGALLAMCMNDDYVRPERRRGFAPGLIVIGVISIVVAFIPVAAHVVLRGTFLQVGFESLFVVLVAASAIGIKGWIGRLLTNRFLAYVGTISYGIYVYHYFVPSYLARLHVPAVLVIPISPLVCLAVAAISFRFYERPINNLKRYFPYRVSPGN
jgi:peptidoglycan/LPS O-acetylase OafA/YrhL